MRYFCLLLIFTFEVLAELKFQAPTIPAKEGKVYNEIIELRSKDVDAALKKLIEVPDNYSAAFDYLQAAILVDMKKDVQAVTSLKKALKKLPDFYQARLTLAQIYLNMQNYKEAVPQLIDVVKLGRADSNIWKSLSACHIELKNYESALLALNQARLFSAGDESLGKATLNIYLLQEDYQKSETLVKELIEKNPDNKNYWSILVQSLIANDKQKEALLNQELKVKLFGLQGSDLRTLADLYYNEGVYLKAAEVYLKVKGEISGQSLIQAARCFSYSGFNDKVIETLDNPQGLSPSGKEDFYSLKGEAFVKSGKKEDALKCFLESLKFNSNNHYAQFYAAEIYEEQKQFSKALDFYARASKKSSFFVSARLRKARVHMLMDDNEQALSEVQDVIKVDNSSSTKDFYNYLKAKVQGKR